MEYVHVLNENEKRAFISKLAEQFGTREINGTLIQLGKERIILFTSNITEKEIKEIVKNSHIESIGVYIAKIDPQTNDIRLSIEGSQLLYKQGQITKSIFELRNEQEVEQWMSGQELPIGSDITGTNGFLIMKYKDDILGSGKASQNKIGNFIPKSRRLILKSKSP